MDKSEQESRNPSGWKFPLVLFLLFRFGLWGWMLFVRHIYAVPLTPDKELRPYMGILPTTNPFLEVWQRWDTLQYQAVAERGYTAFSTAFFTTPLYPGLMRLGAMLTGSTTLLAGLLISSLFCLAGLFAFYRLAQVELGDERLARRALIYLCLFPTAFFLFAPYTESLFLLGSVLCLLALRQKRWVSSGLWGILAALSRLTGALLFVPAAWAAWMDWRQTHELKSWLSPFLIGIGSITYPLYIWLGMGRSPLAPFLAQSTRFHGGFTLPGINMILAVRQIWLHIYPLVNFFDLTFTLAFLIFGFWVWKKLDRIYGVYYLAFMLLYLTRIAAVYPLLSMTRYVLALFPAFLVLAIYGKNPKLNRLITYTFLLGTLFFSAQFAIWGWAG